MTKLCDFKRDNLTVLAWLKMTLMKMFLLKFLLSKLSIILGPSWLGSSRDLLPEDTNLSEQGPDARDGISPVERSPNPELPHFSGRAVSERNEYWTSRGGSHGEMGPSDQEVGSISLALHSITQAQNLHATKRGVISVQINITSANVEGM